MAISYNKLWKLLVDKKMSKADLRKAAGIAPNTMTRLRRDEEVTLSVLHKICATLEVDIGDIMEFLPDFSADLSLNIELDVLETCMEEVPVKKMKSPRGRKPR